MGNSRPKTSPRQTPRWQENAVKALVLGGWEQRRVAETLNLPRSTVSVISRRVCGHLLYKREPVVRYEYDAVGGLIHLDIKRVARFDQPGHRVTGNRSQQSKRAGWEYVHVCVDDYSRWSYAEVLPDQKATSAAAFLKRAVAMLEAAGSRVKRVMTDNGPCYKSRRFKSLVKKIGARHIFTRPYRPQTNGKAERFIQSLSREWSYGRSYQSSNERNSWLPCYLKWFNLVRPHGSLGNKPPISRLAVVNNVSELYI